MTMVKIHDRLSVNPEHVTCVRELTGGGVYVETVTGTRHEMSNTSVDNITNLLNGVDTQRVTS